MTGIRGVGAAFIASFAFTAAFGGCSGESDAGGGGANEGPPSVHVTCSGFDAYAGKTLRVSAFTAWESPTRYTTTIAADGTCTPLTVPASTHDETEFEWVVDIDGDGKCSVGDCIDFCHMGTCAVSAAAAPRHPTLNLGGTPCNPVPMAAWEGECVDSLR